MKHKIIAIISTIIIKGGTYLLEYYSYEFGKNIIVILKNKILLIRNNLIYFYINLKIKNDKLFN